MTDFYLGDEIAHFLAAQLGGSWAVGTNIFVGQMPDPPDIGFVVIERGGGPPLMTLEHGSGSTATQMKVDQPGFQILLRDTTYQDGQATAQAIFKALHAVSEQTLNTGGATFHLIYAVQSPTYLGRDGKQRHEFSQNFRALMENPNR